MDYHQFRAMNTEIVLAAEGDPTRAAQGFDRAREYIQAGEARFSRFLETSELSQLNRSAGKWFQASSDLYAVVALAWQFYHRTRGLFDPSILPSLRRIGYDRSLDLIREQGAAPLFESLLAGASPSFGEVEFDEPGSGILLPSGMAIDLGGIAKGWIAEQAALVLSQIASASACAVNAGGDIFLIGLPDGREWWPIDLEDPLDPQATLTTLKAGPGAVATSAVTKRTWKQGRLERHHLIDPRTGEPAVTDWLSVTVLSPHASTSEVYAKALLIAGPHEGDQLAGENTSQVAYLAVDREKKIWGTANILEHVYVD